MEGDLRRGCVACGGIEHHGAGQVVECEVQAGAGLEEITDFRVGIVAAEEGVDFYEDEFRYGKAESTGDLSCNEFSDQCQRSLACAAELDDVQTEVIRLHDCGQGAAFPERENVTRGVDGAKHQRQCKGSAQKRTPPARIGRRCSCKQ